MVKFNKSAVHRQHNLTFFKGSNFAALGSYLFQESADLFGEENLGPNLLEYDESENLPFNFKDDEFQKVLNSVGADKARKLCLIDMKISNIPEPYELKIEYSQDYFSNVEIHAVRDCLDGFAGFKVQLIQVPKYISRVVTGFDSSSAKYIKVEVSDQFVKTRNSSLSVGLKKVLNPQKYVDTQAAMFFLMTSLAATTHYERK